MSSSDQTARSGRSERSTFASDLGTLTLGLIIAALIIFLSDRFLPGDWPLAGVIVAVLIAFGSAIQFFQTMRHREVEDGFAYSFPGYTGERLPICVLLQYQGPEGAMEFDPTGVEFSLGVAPRYLFVIRHSRGSDPKEAGGNLIDGPDGGTLRIRRDEIAHVQVEAFSDAEIERSAQQSADWLTNMLTSGLFGASIRRIPYAAFVSVFLARADGVAVFRIGIPTELTGDALQTLASAVASAVSDPAQDLALAEIGEEFGEIVGQDAADLFLGAGFLSLGALGGSTDGRKGRLMAALLATRIRQLALSETDSIPSRPAENE